MSTIKLRMIKHAESKGITRTKLPEKIGMSYSNFKPDVINNPINSDAIDKYMSIFPDVDLYWLITGIEQTTQKHTLAEDVETYATTCNLCVEKEKRIKLLEIQNEELKQDKQDFKNLLGLKNGKTA